MRVSKEEITSSRNLGLMLHDRQIQPLCGAIQVEKQKKIITNETFRQLSKALLN